MENKIKIFESEEFGRIRTVIINDEPWFVGKDAAKILGYLKGSLMSIPLKHRNFYTTYSILQNISYG